MKKYAIIGASGLIGSHLTKELVKFSKVYAFSRFPLRFKHSFLTWVECNLEEDNIADKIPKNVDAIIYLAQSEYFRDFPNKSVEIFNVNVQRYLETLNFAVQYNIQHVIYASSGGVYASRNHNSTEEDNISVSEELGFYLGSKICAEVISSAFKSLLNLQIIRFFFVYGPCQKEQMLIPRLIKNIKEGGTIFLEGENGVIINPLHVSDAVTAIQKLLEIKNSETYNAGGDTHYSLRHICTIIGNILGKEPIFHIKESQETKKMCGNIQKFKEVGWLPKTTLIDGIRDMIDYKK